MIERTVFFHRTFWSHEKKTDGKEKCDDVSNALDGRIYLQFCIKLSARKVSIEAEIISGFKKDRGLMSYKRT